MRETTMKARNLLLGLLLGAVALLPACSSNSPTAPPPSPTPVAFSISLTAAPAETLVNGGILLSARVTSGGRDVPDNTSVTFTISSCVPGQTTSPGFGENMLSMTCETTRTTSGGVATATIWSSTEGTYEVVARVPGQTAKVNVTWKQPVSPGTLAVYSVTPRRGRPEGGEQVTVYGRGFAKPLTVDFVVGASVGHAQVLGVNAAATEITVVTPPLDGEITGEVVADVRVTAAAGTAGQRSDTLVGGYTYERTFGEPRIYAVDPPRGAWAGGEQVTITGANFFTDVRVRFGAEEGQVTSVSADRARITVLTPRHGGSLTEEQKVDVTVVTRAGTVQQQQVTLAQAYTYLPDSGVPALYSVVPSKGSPRGGETVILTGRNFTQPVTVEFIVGAPVNATLPATVQSVSADGTRIVVITPQASPQDLPDDTLADIRITNLVGSANSQSATFTDVYTYTKESKLLDVYSVFPNRGAAAGGQTVVIAGRGFVQPLKVDFIALGGSRPAEVIEVGAGGQTIKVITPAVPQQITTELVVDVRVTAAVGTPLEQQATLTAAYTYERPYGAPRIFAVIPNKGSYSGGEQVTIYGANFFEPLGVAFGTEVVRVLSFTQDQIVVQTRLHTDNFITEELTVPITVVTRFDTGQQQTVTMDNAYTYLPNTGVPQLYTVVPSRGSPRGGETVTLTGRHFHEPLTVEFIIGPPVGATRPATVVDVVRNGDGTMTAHVITPEASPDPLPTDVTADIRITNLVGTAISQTATFAAAFTYERESKDIVIYSVAPNRGSANGGEQVTIYGKGFAAPAQVDFLIGNVAHSAAVVSVTADTIVCITPAVPESQNEEVTADIKVTAAFGLPTQKEATLAGAFTFIKEFEAPRIFSINPEVGRIEGNQTVTIYGSGFFEPIRVTLRSGSFPVNCQTVILPSGVLVEICDYVDRIEDAEVLDVPNSETVVIRTPGHPNTKALQDIDVDVKVYTRWQTAQEQSVQRDRGFTYKADYVAAGTPIIYSIVPDKGPRAGGQEVVIRGENLCGRRLGDADGRICDPAISPVVTFALGAPLSGTLKAEVLSFTADGRSLVVKTPQASVAPLQADVVASITVTNAFNNTEASDQVLNGYTYVADFVDPGIPVIFSINPITGSRLGGEQVEIRGENLCGQRLGPAGSKVCDKAPTVTFTLGAPLSGTLNAEVVANSWLPDGKKITVITPRASTEPLLADVKATVAVANDNGTDQVVDGFVYLRDETPLAIYSVVPSRGRPEGGQTVTIYGRGFVGPIVNVDFTTAAGGTRAAEVVSFNAAGSEIVVKTPATGVDASVEHVAAITVTVAVGTANQKAVTLEGAYTYEKRYAAPLIYSVVPNKGSYAGGDTLQIIGANFVKPLRVTLGGEDAEVLASSTESVLQVKTPLHPNTHLTQELTVDVTVYTSFETAQQQQASLAGGFTWIPDTGVPLLYSVQPNKGNPRGGETVILTGSNFTQPVTVEFLLGAPFGTALPATVVSVNAAGTQITVRTPQVSPTPVTSEVVTAIRITNLVGSAFSQTATYQGVFTYESESDLAIYAVTPNRGRAEGGDTVQILGRGFITPVDVFFIVAGQARQAEVVSVTGDTEIVVLSPATGLDATTERIADIQVTAAAGTANQITRTLAAAYTYEKYFGAPAIYAVIPDRGSYAGNEVVTIVGANFFTPLRVFFGAEEAAVDTAASTAATLVVRTPQHLQGHLTEDLTVDVIVQTRFDTAQQQNVTLAGGFTWKPDTGVPLLYSVTPNKGDPRGGEEVTLVGKNFTSPVTVEFILGAPVNATYPATVTSVDTAGGVMKIRTPQASPSPLTQEVEVDIRITNLVGSPTSKNATFVKAFTYKTESDLAIYTVQPNRGSPTGGQTVEIRGRGFIPTVNVHFLVAGQERQAEVVAVTDGGSRIEIRTPASNVDATVEQAADVRVTVAAGTANQKSTTLLAAYTYEKQFAAPAIYAVVPNRGAHAGGETIEILGSGFFTPVRVTLGNEPAEVLAGSTESRLLVRTPVHNPSHLTADLTVDVTVITRFETAQQQQALLPAGFTWVPDTGAPILYQVVPAKGSPRGGEEVQLIGRNFTAPVTVDFILGAPLGTTLPATVLEVISNADGTQTIRIKTPQASPTPVTTDVVAAIRIANLVGSANSQNATFQGVFTYEGEARSPLVYFVEPDKGSPRGGETVTVYGRFFLPPVRVQFTFTANGVTKTVDAEVVGVNSEGTEITVITPTASLEPLANDAPADIRVTTQYSTGRDQFATLPEGFLYLAERPTPELYALTPNSGPIEGGTRVTITGSGFQYPVQVFFTIPVYGAIQAQVVSVNFSRIVVIAPSITPMEPGTPTLAQVTAINMESGKISNALTYRYGNAMFISAIAPTEGPDLGGTMVTIFGQGFVAPVAVTLAGVPAQILTVAGTEIVVKSNAPSDRECEPISGPVTVTNIDSNLSADGPSFTYRPARPLITSVEVFSPQVPAGNNIVREYDPTRTAPCNTNDPYNAYTVIVRGENFEQYPNSTASAMSVIFTNPEVEVLTTWVSANEVRFTLPDLSAVELDTAACTINGAPGLRDIPTGIPFTIRNNNNQCEDELDPAIILEPCDPNCRAGIIQVSLTPPTLNLGIGTTATMTACISAVQTGPTNVTISTSGTTGIVDYSLDGIIFANGITVVIPAGQVCETFTIRGLTGGAVGTVAALDVSLGGSTDVSQITVGALTIALSPSSLNLPVGGTGLLTIQLSAPAPAGGAPVLVAQAGPIGKISFGPLTGNCTNPPPFPATVLCSTLVAPITTFTVVIPAGSSTYSFPVNGLNASPPGPVTVSATLDPSLGGASASSSVLVGQFNVTLSPSTLNIPVGGTGTFTVTLDAPAYDFDPAINICGIQVSITQTGPGGVITFTADPDNTGAPPCGTLPPATGPTGAVTINTGTQIATFTVNGVSGGGPVTVTVSLPAGVGGATASSTVTVSTYILTLTPESLLIPLGTDGNFNVTLNAPAPPGNARIFLTQVGQVGVIELRDSTGAALLPFSGPNQYVDVLAGNVNALFRVRGLQEGGPIQLTATLDPALGASTDQSTVSVGTLQLSAQPTTLTVPVNGTNTFILSLSKAQTSATTVNLATSNGAVAYLYDTTVPYAPPPAPVTSVVIPANSLTSPPVGVYGVNLGPATVYASLPASLGGSTAQVTVNVTQAIQFVPASLTVPVGSQGTFTLQVAAAQASPTTILLDYSGTSGAVAGPSTVTLPAGSNTVSFNVWGMQPTATAVSIVATLPNTLPAGLAGATAVGTVTVSGAPYALTFTPSTINLPVGASTNLTATFNYPLPPAYTGLTYPVTVQLAMSAPGASVIFIQGTAGTGNDVFTWTNPLQTVADSVRTIDAQANGGPVTITGVGPAAIGSPVGTATATVGPASTTLTMSPSPFMWVFGAPAPSIGLFISPVQATNTIVQLQSSNPAVVQVPSTATILAGNPSVTFTPTIVGTGTATITATIPPPPAPAGVAAQAAALATTNDVTVFTVTRSPAALVIPAGGSGTITLTLSNPLPASLPGVTAVIAPGPPYVSIASPFTIPAGVTTFDIPVTALAPGNTDGVNIVMPASVGGTILPGTTLTVTPLSFTLSVGATTLYVGASTTATVETALPVPSDTLVTISEPAGTGDLTVPATATIPAGATTASFTVTGLTLGGPRTLRANLPASLSTANADQLITIADLPLTLTTAPDTTVYQGSMLTATYSIPAVLNADTVIAVSQAGGSGGLLVIPATATIPAGSTSASINVLAGAANGARNLRGTLPAALNASAAPHVVLGLTVADQTLTLTPNPLDMAPNATAPMTATVSRAPLADAAIALVSSAPGVFTVPAGITIPAGLTTTSFNVTSLNTNGTGTVTGTLPAALDLAPATPGTATVNVNALSVVLSPPNVASLMAGGGQLFTVSIGSPVAQDITVQLASADPGLVSVPASVLIPAGSTSAAFTAVAESTTDSGPAGAVITATLPAALGGDTDTATVGSVIPLTIAATPSTVNLPSLTEETVVVTTGTLLAKNVSIALASLNPISVGLFDLGGAATGSLTIPAGSNSGAFRVRGLAVTFPGPATTVALNTSPTLGGGPAAEATVTVGVQPLALQFAVSTLTIPHAGTGSAIVRLRDGSGNPVTVAVPTTVTIASANPAIAYPTTAQVVIAAGASQATTTIFGNTPGGPVTITGQLDASVGGATATLEAGVSIVGPPTITSLSPNSGPDTGGTNVTVNGTLFWSGATVTFDGIPATNVQQVSPSQITCTTPPHAAGAVNVTVTNPDASTVTLANGFTYVTPGTATLVLSPSPLVWHSAAGPATLTLGISPVQGGPTIVTLTSSNPIVASPPLTDTIPASTATEPFDPGLASDGTATITATLPAGLGSGTATADVTRFGLTFTPSAVTVGVGATVNVTVGTTVPLPLPLTLAVALAAGPTDTVSVPASVTIPAGGTATIPVTGLTSVGPDASIDVTLPAAAGGNTISGAFTADVGAPTWTRTPASATIPIGGTQDVTVTLNAVLPSATTFTLSSGVTNFTFPPTVTIPAGQLSATFTVAAVQLGGPNNLTITAPAGLTPASDTVAITVDDVDLTITPSTVGPLMAGGGHTFTLTVSQAQTTPFDITLSSTSARVSVPASVQMPAGATTTTFQAVAESTGAAVTIQANLPSALNNDATPHATATVTNIIALSIAAAPTSVNIAAATEQEITVTTGVTLAKDVTIALASGQPELVGLFDASSNPTGSVVVPAGSNTATFRVRGVGVGTGISVFLDTPADLGGTGSPEATVTVNVIGLQLQFNVASYTVAHGAVSPVGDLEAILTDGGGGTVTTVIPVTVRITSADPTSVLLRGPGGDPVGASPIDIVIPAGADSQTFQVFGNSPGGPFAVTGALLPPVGNDTAVLQVGVTNPAGAWTFTLGTTIGSTAGGTTVIITGSATHSFWNNVQVTFDGVPATVTIQTPQVLTVTTPAGTAGPADVVITNPSVPEVVTSLAAFTYFGPFTLTSVTPNVGPDNVATPVTVSGTGFVTGATYLLDFGGAIFAGAATSPTTITGAALAHIAGTVSLTVTDPILQTQVLSNAFTYFDQPDATSITPAAGPVAGGTSVNIGGSGFLVGGTYGVTFNGVPATNVVVVSTSLITCTTPANPAGAWNVVVTDGAGQSDGTPVTFTYYAAPAISSLSVVAGDDGGGTALTLNGAGFLAGGSYTVTFGGGVATLGVVTATTIAVTGTPAHLPGVVDVIVTDGAGQTATLTGGFTYYDAPLPTSVSPNTGSLNGGTAVTINGSGFLPGGTYIVNFAGTPATAVVATSTVTITCVTPPGPIGAVAVTVTDPVHPTAPIPGAPDYTYNATVTLSSVTSPNTPTGSFVTSAPGGISCTEPTTGTCSSVFTSGVTLTPTAVGADSGWTWGGACSGCAANAACALAVTTDPATCSVLFN
jgi:hypothetical protein